MKMSNQDATVPITAIVIPEVIVFETTNSESDLKNSTITPEVIDRSLLVKMISDKSGFQKIITHYLSRYDIGVNYCDTNLKLIAPLAI